MKRCHRAFLPSLMLAVLLASAVLWSATPASAAADRSYCAAPSSAVERIICTDPQISRRDIELNDVYQQLRSIASAAQFKRVKSAQLKWLKERDACGNSRACLASAYSERIAQLQEAVETVNGELGSAPAIGGDDRDYCDNPGTAVERVICADPEVSRQDTKLNAVYGKLRSMLPAARFKAIRNEQRNWLKERDACGNSRNCLIGTYRERITVLQQAVAGLGSGTGVSGSDTDFDIDDATAVGGGTGCAAGQVMIGGKCRSLGGTGGASSDEPVPAATSADGCAAGEVKIGGKCRKLGG